MQADLKRRIEAAAKVNRRSLNSEITARLELSLASDDMFPVTFYERPEGEPGVAVASLVGEVETLKSQVQALEIRLKGVEDRGG